MDLLPLASEPFTAPTDRDMLPSERREFVHTHRTCIFGYERRADGPAMSVVYYIPTDTDELLVSTMRDRAKAKVVGRSGKVSLCILDERWPFAYLQVYCDAVVDTDEKLVCDVMMAVGGRMSGKPLPEEARPAVDAMAKARGARGPPVPPLRHVRAASAPPSSQRPGGGDHPLGHGQHAVGRQRRSGGLRWRRQGPVPTRPATLGSWRARGARTRNHSSGKRVARTTMLHLLS